MKRFALIAALLLPLQMWGAVSWVKAGANAVNNTGNTITLSFTPANTGDVVLVMANSSNTTLTFTIAATGYTWTTLVARTTTTGTNCQAWWAYAPNTSAVTITVTQSSSVSTFRSILVDEYTGMDAVNPISGTAVGAVGSSTTPTVNVTPADNNTGLWGGVMDSITAVGSGYFVGANDANQDWSEHKIIAGGSGVAQTVNFTGSGGTWLIMAAAIKPAAGGAAILGPSKRDKYSKYEE